MRYRNLSSQTAEAFIVRHVFSTMYRYKAVGNRAEKCRMNMSNVPGRSAMDVRKTKHYYDVSAGDQVCTCDYCRNYVKEIRHAYPELSEYLETMGIDIEKPFETMPIEPDESGHITPLREEFSPICHNPLLARQIISIAFRIRHCCSSDNCLNFL